MPPFPLGASLICLPRNPKFLQPWKAGTRAFSCTAACVVAESQQELFVSSFFQQPQAVCDAQSWQHGRLPKIIGAEPSSRFRAHAVPSHRIEDRHFLLFLQLSPWTQMPHQPSSQSRKK